VFYPIKLDSITVAQELELDAITLTAPIYVCTPTNHVGWVYGTSPRQPINALDAIRAVQDFAGKRLDLAVYTQLPSQMKAQVKASFMQRNGSTVEASVAWADFVAGRHTSRAPIGQDYFLGCTEVWGIESVSFSGRSILHLA
jgi:hypothetical protein